MGKPIDEKTGGAIFGPQECMRSLVCRCKWHRQTCNLIDTTHRQTQTDTTHRQGSKATVQVWSQNLLLAKRHTVPTSAGPRRMCGGVQPRRSPMGRSGLGPPKVGPLSQGGGASEGRARARALSLGSRQIDPRGVPRMRPRGQGRERWRRGLAMLPTRPARLAAAQVHETPRASGLPVDRQRLRLHSALGLKGSRHGRDES